MAVDALSLLILFAVTILIGYIGSAIFHKTRVPDVLWLLIFGFLVGPVFALVDRSLFIAVSPLLAALALLLILFDSGLHLNIYQLLRTAPRSMMLAFIGIIMYITVIGAVSMYLFSFDPLEGLLMGSILAGTSSPVVISIINRLYIKEDIKRILLLESIITDPITIIAAITFIQLKVSVAPISPLNALLAAFSIGGMIGLIAGLVWLFVLDKLRGRPFDYMLTIAIAFIVYSFVEFSGGSGAISALAFGLVLGNGRQFSIMLKFKKIFSIEKEMRYFQDEISFFIRSFFFVFLGLIVVINPVYLLYGVLLSIILIILRVVASNIAMIGLKASSVERKLIMTMAPRGLAAAVVAQLPISFGLANAEIYFNVAFIVIVATVIYSSVATMIFYKPDKKIERKAKKEQIRMQTIKVPVRK